MASLSPPIDPASSPAPDGGGVAIARATPEQWREALSLLLTGRGGIEESTVHRFMGFAADQHLALEHLWVASRRGRLLGTALIVPCAGRTALIFLSPNLGRATLRIGAELAASACRGQDPAQIRLVQALLDPGQEAQGEVLIAAGFRPLACLIYMERPAGRAPSALDLGPGFEVVRWSQAARPRFARAILASYQDTLDCPGLLGLRQIDDIIDGHMAAGRFVPELWFAVEHEGQPVGAMLLNVVAQRDALELVYLGLGPTWRRRGMGRRLLLHALGQARAHGVTQLILAVDERNTPAMQMYTAMQFSPTARKTALILTRA